MLENGLIETFYNAFANGDPDGMAACYHPNIEFTDPVFGRLKGEQVAKMWKMLIERSRGNIEITFADVRYTADRATANWTATYIFTKTGRKVVNRVKGEFLIAENRIVRHQDHFNFWCWSRQAFGFTGWIFGWTKWFQAKVRGQALMSLDKFSALK